jgi:hypothetical protein
MSEPVLIEFDPEGSWKANRFEFCNALEAVLSPPAGRLHSAAWAELELLGVRKIDVGDPNAVHINMLRGTIAKPSATQIIHIYQDEIRDAIRAEQDAGGLKP